MLLSRSTRCTLLAPYELPVRCLQHLLQTKRLCRYSGRYMPRTNTRSPIMGVLKGLDPHRQEAVRPILERPRKYVLLSLRKMAQAIGCHPSTLLRIFRDLGFSGYHDFRRFLHEQSIASTTSLDLVEDAGSVKQSALLSNCLQRDMEN